ncbi:MAG TPA: alanine dehydrogenase [Catalimonadaceae bacterium]|nr:alanine dehydrogenase [Catalimonadaceae bacterium]
MKIEISSEVKALTSEALLPKEQLLEVQTKRKGFSICVPREIQMQENRLCLTPEATALLINNGHEVCIEAGAGTGAKFKDNLYSEAGAKICYSPEELYKSGDVILKVTPPSLEEIEMIEPGSTLISALQLSQLKGDYFTAVNKKKITAVAFEMIEDVVGSMPIVRAMSEIAGNTVLLIAAEYLNSRNNGRGIIMGGVTGVPPTKIVIIGAGTVGEYAARTALGLGAEVKVFDNHLYKLRRMKQRLGNMLFTSTIDYANLSDALKRADVVIGAIRAEDGLTPCVVTEEMVSTMKSDSIIIDVSIDQGGCFETSRMTTHTEPVFKKYDVIHYCVPNIASRVAHTATTALSNILTPMLIRGAELGGMEDLIFTKDWFMKGVYCFKGSLTNKNIARMLNMRHKDLALFKMARM